MKSSLHCVRLVVVMALALLLLEGTARGQGIYEPFNYPLNSNVSGGTGGAGWLAGSSWQLGGNANGAVIVPGLTFSGTNNTLATQGNAVELTDNGGYPYDDIIGRQIAPASAITSGNLWISYLVYMPTVDNGGGFFEARVNSSAAGWWNSALFRVESKAQRHAESGHCRVRQSLRPANQHRQQRCLGRHNLPRRGRIPGPGDLQRNRSNVGPEHVRPGCP